MKLRLLFLVSLIFCKVQSQELSYYLPTQVQYDPQVPTPESVIGHQVGEWHVTHDRLVAYMKALAKAAPGRIQLQVTGTTYESRQQLLLIITSPQNHQRLEQIRQEHLQLSQPGANDRIDISKMPAVVWQGFSIHGNEPSGANASLLTAYYLAAAQGPQIDKLLENLVILLDPSFNPDGLNRFATWVNQHKSKTSVTDPNSREFSEVWPGGRFNHYWFDLNRDWLPAQHRESQNRLKWFHQWMPNILTDHHEMGSNASFFFQPGVPSRVNPLTPTKNQELTGKIARFHAKYLDQIGSMYYTKEGYDDFYYGKGSTYPDVQGCVGILFEQASSRGHAQQTVNGVLRFPFTIRNQFVTTLSTLEAAQTLRTELLEYQRGFFADVLKEGLQYPTKAFVYGDAGDSWKTSIFTEMLLRHNIQVYALNNEMKSDDFTFGKESSFVVPLDQPQHRLIRSIFEKQLKYQDSLFYDVTSWTMPLAFGLPSSGLTAAQWNRNQVGARITEAKFPAGMVKGGRSTYAYAFSWSSYRAPRLLQQLYEQGIQCKVIAAPFSQTLDGQLVSFQQGSILVPVAQQRMDGQALYNLIQQSAVQNGVVVQALQTGFSEAGIDLGSNKAISLTRPSLAMLVGTGVSATDAGEVWHLLDQRFDMPVSHLEMATFNRVDLSRYNTLILVSGNYDAINKDKLKSWVQAGGVLIAFEDAVKWCAQNGILTLSFKNEGSRPDSLTNLVFRYADKENRDGAQQLTGAIFRADLDITHPLGYGYQVPYVDLFKQSSVFIEKPKNSYSSPLVYSSQSLQSGFVTKENYAKVKQSAAAVVQTVGSGRVIAIADNPNFRAFWLGGSKLFLNAIFFGRTIDAGSARVGSDRE
jgi:hypothetical protein